MKKTKGNCEKGQYFHDHPIIEQHERNGHEGSSSTASSEPLLLVSPCISVAAAELDGDDRGEAYNYN